jgi:hypothetical protein
MWRSLHLARRRFPAMLADNNHQGGHHMILHSVLMRLKAAVTGEEKQSLFESIVALKQVIPGISISSTARMSRLKGCTPATSMALP